MEQTALKPGSVKTDQIQYNSTDEDPETENKLQRKSVYRSWLLLCYATGPVASMTRTYVPAVIQSVAHSLGHTRDGGRCALRGNDCYVKFGTGEVHYTSYVLYLKAIYTALEGLVALLLMGIADYANYRKWFLIASILCYGILALPFAALTQKSFAALRALSALYALLNVDDAIYQILEGSYIPLFMRAAAPVTGTVPETVRKSMVLRRGSTVSAMGIFLGNCGGITALLVGIIISYTRGLAYVEGYHNFLLAITVAGSVTAAFAIVCAFFIPSVEGKPKPNETLLLLSFKRMYSLVKSIRKYPHAFVYCVSWVVWNVGFNNFMSVFVLLFRSTLGLGVSDSEYTVYTFMSYVLASAGSLTWMALYPRCKMSIKTWGYIFLSISLFTNFWGCLGINANSKVGFVHRWEFWLFEVFYLSASLAQRSLNRTLYSTLLPEGEEAQYFGLEIMLGVATGWIGLLVNAAIQDRTGNDRFPFVPNTVLAGVAMVLFYLCDTEQGMRDVKKV